MYTARDYIKIFYFVDTIALHILAKMSCPHVFSRVHMIVSYLKSDRETCAATVTASTGKQYKRPQNSIFLKYNFKINLFILINKIESLRWH